MGAWLGQRVAELYMMYVLPLYVYLVVYFSRKGDETTINGGVRPGVAPRGTLIAWSLGVGLLGRDRRPGALRSGPHWCGAQLAMLAGWGGRLGRAPRGCGALVRRPPDFGLSGGCGNSSLNAVIDYC